MSVVKEKLKETCMNIIITILHFLFIGKRAEKQECFRAHYAWLSNNRFRRDGRIG